ncbi:hypothetical protein [Sulfuriflexus mobilis]|uniref:hypothetical protein n=1 Tax=Sulfuriflexus mobilis TaxID=1811807 RepID=UPI000F8428A3|nr:hypothetical protein [Sulfuriflexus mobilis]
MMEVVIEGPSFCDKEGEEVFFNCLYSLPDYEKVTGKGINLHLQLREPVSDETIKQIADICNKWEISNPLDERI